MSRFWFSIIGIIILFLLLYGIFPTLLARVFGVGVIKKAKAARQYTLTFDDGPDPVYTPILLDLLKRYHIKATFFVLGHKAEKHPELIQRMHQEGHLIGIHHLNHLPNWLLFPPQIKKRIKKTADIVESITGVRPTYYRPPWGLVTLGDWLITKRFQIVLWTVMVGDWIGKRNRVEMEKRLVEEVNSGSIIVLHDSGETFGAAKDAPQYMLEALEVFLQESQSQGYTCVRLDQFIPVSHRSAS
ncbi:polysaccharide deacetylase family protein [Camelliibacillus cellulosilyticus]|uniref:Polysaccharide deacetylase family protein n=1 Tax=Camelliibacillus cellulosilyticus TaxID=2174486 RepID=A0ABV9GHA1_9BACL